MGVSGPPTQFTNHLHSQTSVLDVCKWYGASEVVLLDTGVASLCRHGVTAIPAWSRNVHADHVPEVPLQGPPMVVWRSRWR